MNIHNNLSEHNCVALDTGIFAYALNGRKQGDKEEVDNPIKEIFTMIENGEISAVTSTLTISEILTNPLLKGNYDVEKSIKFYLQHFPNLTIAPITSEVAVRAAHIEVEYNIESRDALFIATAIINGADIIVDRWNKLPDIKEIKHYSIEGHVLRDIKGAE